MKPIWFFIIFVTILLTIRLAHCETIEDTLARTSDARVVKQGDAMDSLLLEQERLKYHKFIVDSLKKELNE
jgi:hypothetical protein